MEEAHVAGASICKMSDYVTEMPLQQTPIVAGTTICEMSDYVTEMPILEDEKEMSEEVLSLVVKVIDSLEEEQTREEMMKSIDVAEVYSPRRVTAEAKKWGLRPGDAMDLTNGWDFTLKRHRGAAKKYVKEARPKLLIGSP